MNTQDRVNTTVRAKTTVRAMFQRKRKCAWLASRHSERPWGPRPVLRVPSCGPSTAKGKADGRIRQERSKR